MSSSRDWMRGMGGRASWSDTLAAVRAEHGKGASRWLAGQLGVSQRTAQRYLKGVQRPGKGTEAKAGKLQGRVGRQRAAERLRRVRRVNVGVIAVETRSDGTPDGTRRPPHLNIGPIMDRVAAEWLAGNEQEAQELFDAAVMAAYSGEDLSALDPDNPEGLAAYLNVSDYVNGINETY